MVGIVGMYAKQIKAKKRIDLKKNGNRVPTIFLSGNSQTLPVFHLFIPDFSPGRETQI